LAKKKAVDESIHDRHATLYAAADEARDEALKTLQDESARIDQEYQDEMEEYSRSHKFQSACYAQCKLNNVNSKSIVDVIKLAQELQLDFEMNDSGMQGVLEKKFPKNKEDIKTKSVTHRCPEDDVVNALRTSAKGFMGDVFTTELAASDSEPEVTVVEGFTCGDGPNVRIRNLINAKMFLIFFSDSDLDESVREILKKGTIVLYDYCGLNVNLKVHLYFETGDSLDSNDNETFRSLSGKSADGLGSLS
jgi:hypothetical protein